MSELNNDRIGLAELLRQSDMRVNVQPQTLAKAVHEKQFRREALVGHAVAGSLILALIGLIGFIGFAENQPNHPAAMIPMAENVGIFQALKDAPLMETFAFEGSADLPSRLAELRNAAVQLDAIRERQKFSFVKERLSRTEISVPELALIEF